MGSRWRSAAQQPRQFIDQRRLSPLSFSLAEVEERNRRRDCRPESPIAFRALCLRADLGPVERSEPYQPVVCTERRQLVSLLEYLGAILQSERDPLRFRDKWPPVRLPRRDPPFDRA